MRKALSTLFAPPALLASGLFIVSLFWVTLVALRDMSSAGC